MTYKILVTGGAGFIGSHLVDELVKEGHEVVVYDNLEPQVHGGIAPGYLNSKAEYIEADITDRKTLENALQGIEIIFHEAAAVGVGQSMYQIEKYMRANTMGTAILLDILVNDEHNVKKLILASSMSSYGEGKYLCPDCGEVHPGLRGEEQLREKDWEIKCPRCGRAAKPAPTDESKPMFPNSVYAISKRDQEEMALTVGRAYGIPSVALRYFNVYGPRQALSNPYTGVVAIFMSRIKNHNSPVVYEDGLQTRDFVSVADIVRANILAMEKKKADYKAFNVGTGEAMTIKGVGETLLKLYDSDVGLNISKEYRKGDVRHCFADITKIKKIGYRPRVSFEEGMKSYIAWSKEQKAVDKFEDAERELKERGLA